jgi:tetratricopeptide (TPR) repeat protein
VDSALLLCKKTSTNYFALQAMKHVRMKDFETATKDLAFVLSRSNLTDRELAIAASTLGFIYLNIGREDDAIDMLIEASKADNRSSTKETLAILNLAELLYKKGDVVHAYEYVKVALDDANFYGARHRKIQIAAIFPIIEGNKLNTAERQRKLLFAYAIVITILSVITITSAVIIYRQFKKLKEADENIKKANTNLQEANVLLQQVNDHLMEANKIKEEYIGYYFNINSEYLVKIQAFKQAVENKLMTKKYDDIRYVVNNINLKKEREDLYISFDKVFLKLFPDFVTTFNSYFKEEDRIVLKEGQLLNTELRIFALIRMGIHDSEKIAKILDYSIHTIYNYKARIKSKSILPNDEFESKIMEVRAL